MRLSLPLLALLLLIAALIGSVGGAVLGVSFTGKPATEATPTAMAVTRSPTATGPTAGAATALTIPPLPLAGRRIGLDPGHGPRDDLGAVYIDPDTGRIALTEAEFNLDVALRLRDLLLARGASVVLTRDSADTFTAPWPADTNGNGVTGESGDDLQSRIDILNSFGAEVFLSIHANSSSEPGNGEDLQVVYCGAADCVFPTQNKQLAGLVLTHLDNRLAETGLTIDGGSTIDDLNIDASNQHMFILGPANPPRHPRATTMPGVIGETLYVTLPSSAAHLLREDIRQAIALGYSDALQEYLTTNIPR